MSCLILPLLVSFLFESGDHSLLVGQVASYRRDKIRFDNKEVNWDSVFCGSVLLAVGGGVLAEGSCASFVLCDVRRVWIPILDWDCVCVSLRSVGRICDQLDSSVYYKKVLLNCVGRILGGTKNRS